MAIHFQDLAADWVVAAAKKLDALARHKRGWDSYDGRPLDPHVHRFTLQVFMWLQTWPLPIPAVVLTSAGSIQLEWAAGGKELVLGLDKTGIEYLKTAANGAMEEGTLAGNPARGVRDLAAWLLDHQKPRRRARR